MINGYPLNSAPVNGMGGSIEPTDPQPVEPPPPLPPATDPVPDHPQYPGFQPIDPPEGYSLPWTVSVILGGQNVESNLTGSVRVDRSEGAAGVAEFELFYPVGAHVPISVYDASVVITFTSRGQQQLLFTGWVAEPTWHAATRIMRITATDRLQQRVEAMTLTAIDALTGGMYSPDVFSEEIDDHWRYAQDRLSTRPASLDCSTSANLRVTRWQTKQHADYVFNAGSTVYQSVDVRLAHPKDMTNRVEITAKYRYPRLWQASATYQWSHPGTNGHSGMQGFCSWRADSTELPTIDMYLSAVSSAGFVPVSATWSLLPATAPNPCGDGQPWINSQEGEHLILGGRVVARKRWVQQITETYTLVVATADGLEESTRVISRMSVSASVERGTQWADSLRPYQYSPIKAGGEASGSDPVDPPDTVGDWPDENRRENALKTAIAAAQTEIIAAHRRTSVQWQCPTALVAGIDTVHTLELADQNVHARGKCIQRVDELSIETGSALTTLAIAITTGAAGTSSGTDIPARIGETDPDAGATSGTSYTLPTQLGGRYGIPDYDEEKNGFSGNYSFQPPNAVTYPRRFAAASPDIPDTRTDERVHESQTLVRVAFAGDLLEL